MSLDRVRIGFIPLVDAAVPIVAAERGFAAEEGLELDLVREISWSNVRDRLTLGHFDAAHLLAPVAIATTLGLGAMRAPLAVPMALGLNGNAITLSNALSGELAAHLPDDADATDPRATAAAFAALVRARGARGVEPPTIAIVFPFSVHNYQVRMWLAAGGLDPDVDARLVVVPPPYMVDALASGHVDGFCVGAPWNSVAVARGLGQIVHLGVDLVRRCPEKVLAVREEWLEGESDLPRRLVRALVKAAAWAATPAHRAELAALLSEPRHLDAPVPQILSALEGRIATGWVSGERNCPGYVALAPSDATRPDPRHARWIHQQMARWGQSGSEGGEAAEAVYRPDFYDQAAAGLTPAEPPPADALGLFED
jgi:NitT/TauT family transport system ATP-binding protein